MSRTPRPNYYAAMPLERDEDLRRDSEAVRRLLEDPDSRVLPIWRQRHLISDRENPRPLWQQGDRARQLIEAGDGWVLLGLREGIAHFAVDISHWPAPEAQGPLAGEGEFVDLRAVGPLLARDDGAVMAYARGLAYWHSRTRFCGVCGSPTESIHGGHVRKCTDAACAVQHFPRTDPAVIMLVHHGDNCLLGRQKIWPAGMHSTLAGFVEPGESLEEAVMREVAEEAGVRLRWPRYHSSQPWPFPASIMLGFHAEARSMDLDVNTGELERAAWYSRAELLDSPEDQSFRLPRKDSIARRLVDDWLYGKE